MAASGYTPILLYASGTASNVPLAANLTSSASGAELALNYADGKLYFKNSSGVVTLLAGSGGGGPAAGSNTQIQFNSSGVFGASANLTWSGTVLSTTGLTATGAITLNTTTNNQSYTTTGAGTITISSGTTGSINNMTIGATTAAAGTFTSLTDSGNLTFTGTGNRITGDFSNATLASRVMFQTSTVNGTTVVGAMPNGTSGVAQFAAFSSAGLTDYSSAVIQVSAATGSVNIISGQAGAGSYFPILFFTSGTEKLRIAADATGTYTFGGTAPRITGDFSGASTARVMVQSSTVNGITSFGLLPNGTGASSTYTAFSNSDPTNSNGIQLNANLTVNRIVGIANGTSSAVPLTFGQGASEQMRLDTSGNLGIGTSSPNKSSSSTALTVNTGTAANYSAVEWSSGNTLNYHINANDAAIYHVAAGTRPWIVYTNGSERMRIDSSGNVGIGTISPAAKFDTTGTGTTEMRVRSQISGDARVGFWAEGAAYNYIQTVRSSGALSYFADLQTFNNASGTERVRIDSSGNVGIGTSSPSYNLHVRNGGGNGTIGVQYGTSTVTLLSAYAAQGDLQVTGANPITFTNNSTERMRIDSSGVVGINNTSPSTWATRLTVQGTVAILGNASFTGSNPTYQGALRLIENPTTIAATGGIEFFTSTFGSGYGWKMTSIDSSGVQLTFATRQNSAAWSEVMRIDSSGNVGIGTAANASAILDAQSTTKGVRMPNMTTTQKNAISSPAAGLMVFDTTLAKLCVYSGSAWQTITSV